jgi:hypothetical protein
MMNKQDLQFNTNQILNIKNPADRVKRLINFI